MDTAKYQRAYLSRFPHVNQVFRTSAQYAHQVPVVDGKRVVTDINLYKLFVEQCINLLREGGECGIVIPSGIYTDLGAKSLRDLLFDRNRVNGLFCFENRKIIFEGVDSRFKFVVLTFEKGGKTEHFRALFMRHDVTDLCGFPGETGLTLSVELISKLAPDSRAVPEFKSELDVHIGEKLFRFPPLREPINSSWHLILCREFHMTDDAALYHTEPALGRLPLIEGKMIHQFDAHYASPRYWLNENEARNALLAVRIKQTKREFAIAGISSPPDPACFRLDYENYRLAFRDVAASTNERTLISTILAPKCFCPHTMSLERVYTDFVEDSRPVYNRQGLDIFNKLYMLGLLNSFIVDYLLRQRVTSHLSFFFIYNLPVPRLEREDCVFKLIVTRAARLTCTTPEFDDLAKEVGLKPLAPGAHYGVTDPVERARLRAELDGLIAHLYGLTEAEFAHILGTFPLVAEPVKIAALNAYRDVERGLIR